VDKYNNFTSPEDAKRMLRNLMFYMDKHDARLVHVESHVPFKYYGKNTRETLGSSAGLPIIVSSSYND